MKNSLMEKYEEYLMWPVISFGTLVLIFFMYPFFLFRNLGYHLRAPSVFLYSAIFFLLDRISKFIVLSYSSHFPITVVKNFFDLTFVKNPGVAFGWFPDWRFPPVLMALVMIGIISYYSFQLPSKEKLTRWSLALLVGGAIGNLYDRLMYGYVVDFFLFHLGRIDFPVFNLADVAIDLGVVLLFLDIFWINSDEVTEDTEISTTKA